MLQDTLHPDFDVTAPFDWSGHAVSLSFDERRIIRWIIDLHNGGKPFDVDPCYSIGRFWEGLPQPRLKYDIKPQAAGVTQASADALPLADGSVHSIMFDPPFIDKDVDRHNAALGKIESRFFGFKTIRAVWEFYSNALAEFRRVLDRDGVLVVKCQDVVSGAKQHLSHVHIINTADRLGFVCVDLFVLGGNHPMWSPNMKNQKHARKNHCYFLVFVKRD